MAYGCGVVSGSCGGAQVGYYACDDTISSILGDGLLFPLILGVLFGGSVAMLFLSVVSLDRLTC